MPFLQKRKLWVIPVVALAAVLMFGCSSDDGGSGNSLSSSSSDIAGSNSSSSNSDIAGSSSSVVRSSSSVSNSSSSAPSNGNPPTSPSSGPVAVYGKLKASGNNIVGSKTGSTAVQVRGVSLGWSNTGWESASFFNEATINAMVNSWKAEIIRVPMGYSKSTIAGEYAGSYLDDKTGNMNRVKTAINAAISNGVYVIIDWHSHDAHNGISDATNFFSEMAQTYGNYDNVIFEIFNEPVGIDWSDIKTYATSIIKTIREHSNNLILVGTPNYDQNVNAPVGSFLSDNNVAYVVHFYAASHSLTGSTMGGSSTFQSAINSVRNNNKPVFVSEYGTVSADGNGSHNTTATNTWMTFLNNNNISYCAWHVNNKNEASAFFNTTFTPSPSSGWATTSNMTPSGQYIYNNLVSWAKSAPWRNGGSSTQGGSGSGNGQKLYCDYGSRNSCGGGCEEIASESDCDTNYGIIATSCGRTDLQYCYYSTPNKCYSINDSDDLDNCYDYGDVRSSCPSSTWADSCE